MGGMERDGARRLAPTRPRHQHPGDLRTRLAAAVDSPTLVHRSPKIPIPRSQDEVRKIAVAREAITTADHVSIRLQGRKFLTGAN